MTAWYRAGTFSATNGSPTITGALTAWLAWARVGDIFRDVATGAMYEVGAIGGETSITLTTNYAGTTGSGKDYEIIPVSTSRNLIANLSLELSDLTEAVKLGFRATSTSNVAIGTGSKTFQVQSGLPILPGAFMVVTSRANISNRMSGQVTSYTGTTLVLNVTAIGGSGTFADWNLNISGVAGLAGTPGATGSPGPPNALSIGTVTTLSPGASATATITGTAPNQTLSLGIPAGQNGTGLIDGNKGDITVSASGATWAINEGAIVNADFANMAALTIKGNATNAAAAPTDIAAATDGQVMRRAGTALGFGTVATAGIENTAVTNAKLANFPANTILGNNTGASAAPAHLTVAQVLAMLGSGAATFPPMPGRITLQTGTPVTSADVVAATTIFYTFVGVGRQIAIFDGTNFVALTMAAQLSLALTGNVAHTGYHQAARNFDLFVINDAGTLRLVTGPAWTSDSARGAGAGTTELEMFQGVLVNAQAITARFGNAAGNTVSVAARQATFVGSMRCTADGQTEDSLVNRLISNADNITPRLLRRAEAGGNWNYSTAAWRQANSNASNRVTILNCLAGRVTEIGVLSTAQNSTATPRSVSVSIGLNSTTAEDSRNVRGVGAAVAAEFRSFGSDLSADFGLGFSTLNWIEFGGGADTQTFYGFIVGGLYGEHFA